MKGWIGTALVAAVMMGASMGTVSTAAAAPQRVVNASDAGKTTDFSARRSYRRYPRYPSYLRYPRYYRYPHQSYEGFYYRPYPSYYGRPNYYRPYPAYAPYAYGFRYGPMWW